MAAPEGSPGADSVFSDYLRVILRWKWLVVSVVLIAGVSAYIVSSSKQALFQGEAQMILTGQNVSAAVGQQSPLDAATAARLAQTMAELARVPAVAERTLASAGVSNLTPNELLQASTVTPSSDADVLTFSVTEPDQAQASHLATTYAEAFRSYQHELDITSINQAQAKVEGELQRLGHSGSHTSLRTYLTGQLEQLRSLALESSNAYVVHPAGTAAQVQPKAMRDTFLAAAVGLLLGIALAFLADTLDTRVKTVDEIRDVLGLRVLARVPALRRQQEQLVMLAEPQSAQAEAFRTLRINLELVKAQRELKTLMVGSAEHEDGKSTTVANLAVALARAGNTVAVVDCDLHSPALHRLFNIRSPRGLLQVLAGDVPIERALTPVKIRSKGKAAVSDGSGNLTGVLEVLPAGRGQAVDGLLREAIPEVLRELESRFDYVLVDTPPLLEFADGLDVSAHVDAVLVVARVKSSKRDALAELRQTLGTLPAEPVGIVATGTETPAGAYYAPEPQAGRPRGARRSSAVSATNSLREAASTRARHLASGPLFERLTTSTGQAKKGSEKGLKDAQRNAAKSPANIIKAGRNSNATDNEDRQVSLPEERKALLERYMVDSEEAEARAKRAEERARRKAEEQGPREVEAQARGDAADPEEKVRGPEARRQSD